MHVLVHQSEESLSKFICKGLRELGHSTHAVADHHGAMAALVEDRFDVAILDREPASADGLAILKQAREQDCRTPVLMLSTQGSVDDRIAGLDAGADDYLVRPFAFAELVARLTALSRRPPLAGTKDMCLAVGDIEMNLGQRTVTRRGRPIALQPREFCLLEQLMRSPDRIVTRTLLLDRVWNFAFDPRTNVVETHMSRLRSKLNRGFATDAIRTVRGAGYILHQAKEDLPGHPETA